ncbi:MAG: FAD-binding oxidoreductase [Stappiaceae bacterium]
MATQRSEEHVHSYYRESQVYRRQWPALSEDTTCDVVVIGGGLVGLTTALELSRHGKSVVLLEGRRVGWGASGRNGGFVSSGYAESLDSLQNKIGLEHTRELFRLSQDGVDYVRRTILDNNARFLIGGHGWMKVQRHDNIDLLKRRRDRMGALFGVNQSLLDSEELHEYLRTDRYCCALKDDAPFHIHPLDYSALVAIQADSAGARLFERSAALAVKPSANGWRVQSADGAVQCGSVVIATSAYSFDTGLNKGIDHAVLPVATYVITSQSMPTELDAAIKYNGCIADTRRAGDYYRRVDGGKRLLWGGRITTRRGEPRQLARLLRRDILKIYPQLGPFEVDFSWAGLMGYARHKMPIVRPIEEGLWVATALGGHGLNTSAVIGKIVAAAIAKGDERWRLFEPFQAQWGGGWVGRLVTQLEYLRLQLVDQHEERRQSRSSTQ